MLRTAKKGKQLRRRSRFFEQLERRELLATLADPGFENPVQPANNWEQANGTGGGSLAGSAWTFSPTAGITRNISPFQSGAVAAPEGSQFALIQSGGSITQTGAGFVPGQEYIITVAAAIRAQAPTFNDLKILVDGVTVFDGAFDSTTFYDVSSRPFKTATATPVISFVSTNPIGGDQTMFFDNIRITSPNTSLQNLSFELPDIANFQERIPAASWTGGPVLKPSVNGAAGAGIVNNGSAYGNPAAVAGTQAALLKSSSYMEQTVTGLTPGGSYTLSYWAAPRTGQTQNLNVSVIGAATQAFPTVAVTGASTYVQYSQNFVADAATATFRFETLLTGDQSIFIDDVRLNIPPVASANGPYSVTEGNSNSVTLSGVGSVDADGDPITSYQWELDGDNDFNDVVSATPTVSVPWSTLVNFGINDNKVGGYPIALKVVAGGKTSTASNATLNVNNGSPTGVNITNDPTVVYGFETTIDLSLIDPSPRDDGTLLPTAPATYVVDWGDGEVEVFPGLAAGTQASHPYTSFGVKTITVTGIDKDTGVGTASTSTITVTNVGTDMDGNLVIATGESADRIVVTAAGGLKVRINNKLTDISQLDITGGTIFIYGNGGNDTITVSGPVPVQADGGEGNDYIAGGTGDDVLIGGPGSDRLLGGVGNDTIYGGLFEEEDSLDSGNDTISGGVGDDTLYGGDGADNVSGDAGNDIIYGESGNDRLYGGTGDDIVRGGADINQIDGGAGNDILVGGDGADRIYGRGGQDLILGGDSLDYLYGDQDSDLIVADASDSDDDDDASLLAILDDFLANGSTGDYSTYFSSSTITIYTPDTIYGAGGDDVIFRSTDDKLLAKTAGDVVTDVETV